MSIEKGRSYNRQTQANILEPTTERIQLQRADQLEDLIAATGGLGNLAQPRPDLVTPGGAEGAALQRLASTAMGLPSFNTPRRTSIPRPGVAPPGGDGLRRISVPPGSPFLGTPAPGAGPSASISDATPYETGLGLMDRTAERAGSGVINPFDLRAVGTAQGLADPMTQLMLAFSGAAPGLNVLGDMTDPSANLSLAQDYFKRIAAPEIVNTLTASGLGRSGAIGESLARAGSEMALPIFDRTFGARGNLASALLGVGGGALDRSFSGGGALANLFAGLGGAQESRETGRLGQAMQTAGAAEAMRSGGTAQNLQALQLVAEAFGAPRREMYNELIMRPQNLLTGMLTGLPVLTAPKSTNQWGRQMEMENMTSSIIQMLGTAAMAGAMACWVADALYGAGSRKALYARYWINLGWQGRLATVTRWVYRRIGPWLARRVVRHRWLRRVLTPLFDLAFTRGARALGEVA